MKNTELITFSCNFYSQHGEDGVIHEILKKLPERDKWCVEFGAWDGVFLSNVRQLIKEENYAAVLIEGSKNKFNELKVNYQEFSNVTVMNSMVGLKGKYCLDSILKDTKIPFDFDFLSIDVDGIDYHIWESINLYNPKVVCIEFNQTIPTEVSYTQKADPSISHGSSLLSMTKLGKVKGYELVCVLRCNAFFVKKKYFNLFSIEDNSPQALRSTTEYVTYLFVGYNGEVLLQGCERLIWHGDLKLRAEKLQILPNFLLKFPSNYNTLQRVLWLIFVFIERFSQNPVRTLKKILGKIRNV